jgi:hypothetical protein
MSRGLRIHDLSRLFLWGRIPMQQTLENQSFMKKGSTIGSIFIFMSFLFFYLAIKFMMIPMGFIAIPRSHESWLYKLFG